MWAWLARAFGTFLESGVARTLAMKVIILALFVTVLPIILNNFIYDIIKIGMDQMVSRTGNNQLQPVVVTFTGVAAWLITMARLPDCLSLLLSALGVRMMLNMIPFLRI